MNSPLAGKLRNTFFVLLGVAGFLLKGQCSGPGYQVVQGNGGNIAISFVVYFVIVNLPLHFGARRLAAASLALGVVELFEAFNGFGVMINVYDPVDFLANFLGVALALIVDVSLGRWRGASSPA
jgi:hypothetical protein